MRVLIGDYLYPEALPADVADVVRQHAVAVLNDPRNEWATREDVVAACAEEAVCLAWPLIAAHVLAGGEGR